MNNQIEKHILCVECRSTFSDEEIEGHTSCPHCGSTGIPADLNDMVEIKITAHELRILTIWASNYAYSIKRSSPSAVEVVEGICKGLKGQTPNTHLSLLSELQEAADTLGVKGELHNSDGDVDYVEPSTRH